MATKDTNNEAAKTRPQPVRSNSIQDVNITTSEEHVNKPWWHSIKEPGSALQIITAALLAIAVGLIISTQAPSVPAAARVIVSIPGDLWLRALKAVGKYAT